MRAPLSGMLEDVSADELRTVEVCSQLTYGAQMDIAFAARRVRFPSKAVIIRQHDVDMDVYFLLTGRARVSMASGAGREITYQVLGDGSVFGELSAVDGAPRSATVSAETVCEVARIGCADFRALVARHADLANAVISRLTTLSRWLAVRLFESHCYNVKGRICCELLRIAESMRLPATVSITDRDMASRVGTTRENTNRLIGELRDMGAVERVGSTIIIHTPDVLRGMLSSCEVG